jgi:hypothetical protein
MLGPTSLIKSFIVFQCWHSVNILSDPKTQIRISELWIRIRGGQLVMDPGRSGFHQTFLWSLKMYLCYQKGSKLNILRHWTWTFFLNFFESSKNSNDPGPGGQLITIHRIRIHTTGFFSGQLFLFFVMNYKKILIAICRLPNKLWENGHSSLDWSPPDTMR